MAPSTDSSRYVVVQPHSAARYAPGVDRPGETRRPLVTATTAAARALRGQRRALQNADGAPTKAPRRNPDLLRGGPRLNLLEGVSSPAACDGMGSKPHFNRPPAPGGSVRTALDLPVVRRTFLVTVWERRLMWAAWGASFVLVVIIILLLLFS